MAIDKEKIAALTEEYGGGWGINHTRRLLKLIETIGEGQEYDREAVWLACYLHDWGGYKPWIQEGVDHALRSKQVAGEYLEKAGIDPKQKERVLECIEYHHRATKDNSTEAALLFDADALDFLGAVGVLRRFSMTPRDLKKAFDAAKGQMEKLPGALIFDKSRAMAKERLPGMKALLETFEKETFGLY